MHATCIAVVDASRARLFTFERTSEPGGIREQLVERRDLVNPARRRTNDLFSSTRPGVARTGGLQYGLDDHRRDHVDELDAEFSRAVIGQLADLAASAGAARAIVCASPRMLGALRVARRDQLDALGIDELPRDLVKLTPSQLRAHLASYGLLPEPAPRP